MSLKSGPSSLCALWFRQELCAVELCAGSVQALTEMGFSPVDWDEATKVFRQRWWSLSSTTKLCLSSWCVDVISLEPISEGKGDLSPLGAVSRV